MHKALIFQFKYKAADHITVTLPTAGCTWYIKAPYIELCPTGPYTKYFLRAGTVVH